MLYALYVYVYENCKRYFFILSNRQCAQNSFVSREEALRGQRFLGKHARRLQQPAVFFARQMNASTMSLVEYLRDPRTVMKTPRRCCVRQKAGGMYIHLGLKAGLLRQLREIHTRVTNIDIQLNVDGIRAYNNSRTQPFVVGIYCGKNKPNDAQQLMSDTVTELTDVLVNGVSGVYHIHTIRLSWGIGPIADEIKGEHTVVAMSQWSVNCHLINEMSFVGDDQIQEGRLLARALSGGLWSVEVTYQQEMSEVVAGGELPKRSYEEVVIFRRTRGATVDHTEKERIEPAQRDLKPQCITKRCRSGIREDNRDWQGRIEESYYYYRSFLKRMVTDIRVNASNECERVTREYEINERNVPFEVMPSTVPVRLDESQPECRGSKTSQKRAGNAYKANKYVNGHNCLCLIDADKTVPATTANNRCRSDQNTKVNDDNHNTSLDCLNVSCLANNHEEHMYGLAIAKPLHTTLHISQALPQSRQSVQLFSACHVSLPRLTEPATEQAPKVDRPEVNRLMSEAVRTIPATAEMVRLDTDQGPISQQVIKYHHSQWLRTCPVLVVLQPPTSELSFMLVAVKQVP
ncbi:hypothetical protein CLF_110668 [Clonorchis sinensis]|uniref:Uncharacterized protein n=1 Tax=Clonorchis sinensis TaxID=79923 RepID=G7YTQ9_CLOSI|nr:hypothetical protein CLF_110668 [Clonorchis sinensis]